jgi:hypothetical protein
LGRQLSSGTGIISRERGVASAMGTNDHNDRADAHELLR